MLPFMLNYHNNFDISVDDYCILIWQYIFFCASSIFNLLHVSFSGNTIVRYAHIYAYILIAGVSLIWEDIMAVNSVDGRGVQVDVRELFNLLESNQLKTVDEITEEIQQHLVAGKWTSPQLVSFLLLFFKANDLNHCSIWHWHKWLTQNFHLMILHNSRLSSYCRNTVFLRIIYTPSESQSLVYFRYFARSIKR